MNFEDLKELDANVKLFEMQIDRLTCSEQLRDFLKATFVVYVKQYEPALALLEKIAELDEGIQRLNRRLDEHKAVIETDVARLGEMHGYLRELTDRQDKLQAQLDRTGDPLRMIGNTDTIFSASATTPTEGGEKING